MRSGLLRAVSALVLFAALAGQARADVLADARKHMLRGTAAIESAKTEEELGEAAEEFQKATEIAPSLAAAWYNLGAVQAKLDRLQDAMNSYKRYLALAPNAEDARRVADEITKLEYRLEKAELFKNKSGQWTDDDGALYDVSAEGGKMTIVGGHYRSREDFDYNDIMIFNFGGIGGLGGEKLSFTLQARGSKLAGSWEMPASKIWGGDVCTVPSEKGVVEGEFAEGGKAIKLNVTRNKYKVVQVDPPIGFKYCQEVTIVETRPVPMVLRGPLPRGGVAYAAKNDAGGFTVPKVVKGSPEEAAGFQEEDQIVSVDGVELAPLGQAQKLLKLRGAPGAESVFVVNRSGGMFSKDQQLPIVFRRSDVLAKPKGAAAP